MIEGGAETPGTRAGPLSLREEVERDQGSRVYLALPRNRLDAEETGRVAPQVVARGSLHFNRASRKTHLFPTSITDLNLF